MEHNVTSEEPGHFELLIEGEEEIVVNSFKLNVNEKHLKDVVASVKANDLGQCLICLSTMDNPVITMCLHIFCRTCLIQSINNIRGFCPLCRTVISKDDFMHLPHDNRLQTDLTVGLEPSTKMQALSDLVQTFD